MTLTAPAPAPPSAVCPSLADRLAPPMPTDRLAGWLWPALITAVGLALRIYRLGQPASKYFDEVYYPANAQSLLLHGVETNAAFNGPAFVAHPPLGKWFMAAGMAIDGLIAHGNALAGYTPFGWRIAGAVLGGLAILILARVGRRIFRSTLLGCLAALLFSVDGLEFVSSRIGMLDIYNLFWEIAALACLVADRDDGRRRLARAVERGAATAWPGPKLGVRPWRLATGVCLGIASACKWNGLYLVALFPLLAFAWDVGARRTAGIPRPVRAVLRRDWWCFVPSYTLVPLAVYVASWTGWFLAPASLAWDRHAKGAGVIGSIKSLWYYQIQMLTFAESLVNPKYSHPYQSKPLSWFLMSRPVALYYAAPAYGHLGCQVHAGCAREVLDIGNPAIWWGGLGVLVFAIYWWASRRDWRAPLVILGIGAAVLPWMINERRVMFEYYVLPALPYVCLGFAMLAGHVLGPRGAPRWRRQVGAAVVGGYTLVTIWLFAFFYPILAAVSISHPDWLERMWFGRWI